jgi:hypothetical protein
MAQFVTSTELADRLGVEFTAQEDTRADTLLTLASGLVQREARQEIEQTEDDTLTRRGTAEDRIRLPERPVTEVSSVTLAGDTLTVDEDWYLDGDELVRMPAPSSATFPHVPASGWGLPDEELVIVYTHGYATIPDAIKVIVLEAVVRVWVNPGAVMSERYGSEQAVYATQGVPNGMLLTEAERETVREMFRTSTVGTVHLR